MCRSERMKKEVGDRDATASIIYFKKYFNNSFRSPYNVIQYNLYLIEVELPYDTHLDRFL